MGTTVTSTGITFPDSTTQTTAASGGFAAGTVMLFRQTSAPTGWTKDTTNYDGSAIRVVTGSVSSGGSVDFTTAFASQAVAGSVAATTLTIAQMPSHDHSWTVGYGAGYNMYFPATGTTNPCVGGGGVPASGSVYPQGGGGSHTHTFSGTAINLAVKYVDCIFATKS